MEAPQCIAITGLQTFLGQRLAERLLEAPGGPRVVGLDLHRPQRLEGRLRFYRLDLTNPTADVDVAEILQREGAGAPITFMLDLAYARYGAEGADAG